MNIASLYHDTEEPVSIQEKVALKRHWRDTLVQVKIDTERRIREAEEAIQELCLSDVEDSDL
tara:strand:- start:4573 stop:4758 length:186 start_codon:yes stop_codon:yes gene_type:complete